MSSGLAIEEARRRRRSRDRRGPHPRREGTASRHRGMVETMRAGSVIVDISIDQGGCVETAHVTTHSDPTYVVHDVVHYCVGNMPGAVPRTSTYALTNVTIPYALDIARKGLADAVRDDPALALGVNVYDGALTNGGVAEAHGLPAASLGDVGLALTGPTMRARGSRLTDARATIEAQVERFLDHLSVERGLSAHTIAAYRRDLARYVTFLLERSIRDAADVEDADVTAHVAARLGRAASRREAVPRDVGRSSALVDPGVPPVPPARGRRRPRRDGGRRTPQAALATAQADLRRGGHPAPGAAGLVSCRAPRPGRARDALRRGAPRLRARGSRRRRRGPRGGERPGPREGREGAGRPDRPVRARGDRGLSDAGPAVHRDAALALGAVPQPPRRSADPAGVHPAAREARPRCAGSGVGSSPHVAPALVRDPPARGRRRRPGRPGAARARERRHDAGLYAGDPRASAGGLLHVPPPSPRREGADGPGTARGGRRDRRSDAPASSGGRSRSSRPTCARRSSSRAATPTPTTRRSMSSATSPTARTAPPSVRASSPS